MDRRLKLENLNCLILEFFFSKIYFLDQIYWQALVRPFKWHIGKVCIISRKKVTESGKNVKKGLKFVLFHFFDNENGENIFFGPSQLKVPKRWVLMVLKVFQCLLKQKSYKPNKIFLDLLSTNWAFEPLWAQVLIRKDCLWLLDCWWYHDVKMSQKHGTMSWLPWPPWRCNQYVYQV